MVTNQIEVTLVVAPLAQGEEDVEVVQGQGQETVEVEELDGAGHALHLGEGDRTLGRREGGKTA